MESKSCPVCGSSEIEIVLELDEVPIQCNLLWESQAEAMAVPRGQIRLGFCHQCSHLFNLAFDLALMVYSQQYENTLHYSQFIRHYVVLKK